MDRWIVMLIAMAVVIFLVKRFSYCLKLRQWRKAELKKELAMIEAEISRVRKEMSQGAGLCAKPPQKIADIFGSWNEQASQKYLEFLESMRGAIKKRLKIHRAGDSGN